MHWRWVSTKHPGHLCASRRRASEEGAHMASGSPGCCQHRSAVLWISDLACFLAEESVLHFMSRHLELGNRKLAKFQAQKLDRLRLHVAPASDAEGGPFRADTEFGAFGLTTHSRHQVCAGHAPNAPLRPRRGGQMAWTLCQPAELDFVRLAGKTARPDVLPQMPSRQESASCAALLVLPRVRVLLRVLTRIHGPHVAIIATPQPGKNICQTFSLLLGLLALGHLSSPPRQSSTPGFLRASAAWGLMQA